MLKLLSKLTLSQKLMKNVAYLLENALMTFLLKDTIFCILAYFKLLLNLLLENLLMLLYLCAYEMIYLKNFILVFLARFNCLSLIALFILIVTLI